MTDVPPARTSGQDYNYRYPEVRGHPKCNLPDYTDIDRLASRFNDAQGATQQ
jgi:hypothetical protein